MLDHTHHRGLLATVVTAAALAATAPAALARPIDDPGLPGMNPTPVRVVHVQNDQGLDWSDAGIGAAGTLALVLVGFGSAHVLPTVRRRERFVVHS